VKFKTRAMRRADRLTRTPQTTRRCRHPVAEQPRTGKTRKTGL